jgi:hypothetical protein
MSWETILKKKKINIDGLRKITKHILDTYDPKQFALASLTEMVVPVYLKYNSEERYENYVGGKGTRMSDAKTHQAITMLPEGKRIHSIIARIIRNMGYSPAAVSKIGHTRTRVARDDLQFGQKTKGSFYVKDGENFVSQKP